MNQERVRWRAELDHAWESGTHLLPSRVERTESGTKGAPDVEIRFEIRDGVPEVVDLHIRAHPRGRSVRTADLRRYMPLEELANEAFWRFARLKDPAEARRRMDESGRESPYGPLDERDEWRIRADLENARATGRGPSRAELEDVARVYRQAINSRPTVAVENMLGYTRRTAARRIQQARELGLLPPTTPGKKNA